MTSALGRCPTVSAAVAAFGEALLAKSPRTAANYQSALRRFAEFLEEDGRPAELTTDELPANVLERFYTWLLKQYRRASAVVIEATLRHVVPVA